MSPNREIKRAGGSCWFWYKLWRRLGMRRMAVEHLFAQGNRKWLARWGCLSSLHKGAWERHIQGRLLILCLSPTSLWEVYLTRTLYTSDTPHRILCGLRWNHRFSGRPRKCGRFLTGKEEEGGVAGIWGQWMYSWTLHLGSGQGNWRHWGENCLWFAQRCRELLWLPAEVCLRFP